MRPFTGTYVLLMLLALAACMLSCRYYPDEEYVNEIQRPDVSTFEIDLDDFDEDDTVKVFGRSVIKYSIGGSKSNYNKVTAHLGGELVSEYNGKAGSFILDRPILKTGIFELQLDLVAGAGTGSLAEKQGLDTVEVSKKWTVYVFVDRPILDMSFDVRDGYSVFRWEPYTGKHFIGYNLKVELEGELIEEMSITDRFMTSYTDSLATCNGMSKYILTITNMAGFTTGTSSRGADSLDPLVSYNKIDSTVTLTLTPPKLYAHFGYYVVREDNVDRLVIADVSTTTAKFKVNNVGYGYSSEISVERFSDLPDRWTYRSYNRVKTDIVTHMLFQPADKYFFNENLDALFGYRKVAGQTLAQLVRFNAQTLAPVDSFEVFDSPSFDLPYRGEHAYFARDNNIVQLNLNTKAEATYSPFTTGTGPFGITAASNQSVSYSWAEPGPSPGTQINHYEIYSMASGTNAYAVVNQVSSTSSLPAATYVSDDGNFYRDDMKRYLVLAPTPNSRGTVPSVQNSWIGFRKDNGAEFLANIGGGVRVYNANTLQLRETFSISTGNFLCYDTPSQKLIFPDSSEKFGKIWAIDIDTGEKKSYNVSISNYKFIVAGGFVITQTGEYFRIYK
jgi:hypothetical protein